MIRVAIQDCQTLDEYAKRRATLSAARTAARCPAV